jgi:hypothetical protein
VPRDVEDEQGRIIESRDDPRRAFEGQSFESGGDEFSPERFAGAERNFDKHAVADPGNNSRFASERLFDSVDDLGVSNRTATGCGNRWLDRDPRVAAETLPEYYGRIAEFFELLARDANACVADRVY